SPLFRWLACLFWKTRTWTQAARPGSCHRDLTCWNLGCRPDIPDIVVLDNACSRRPYRLATQPEGPVKTGNYWYNQNREAQVAKKLRKFHLAQQIARQHNRSHWRSKKNMVLFDHRRHIFGRTMCQA